MELYNLNFGNSSPPPPWTSMKIGPFTVTVKPDYPELAKILPQPGRLTKSFDGTANLTKARSGGWVATADCNLQDNDGTTSILTHKPIADGGVWDLCQILTFLNGRWITADPRNERYQPDVFGPVACTPNEILAAAQVIWEKREEYHKRKLIYAFLLSNLAFSLNTVNAQAAMVSAAFNAIYDDWGRQASECVTVEEGSVVDLTKSEKATIKATLNEALDSLTGISPAKREAMKRILVSKVQQGLASPIALIQSLLTFHGIIPKKTDAKILERIRFINEVRNKFVHCGHFPEFTKKPELSIEISIFIVGRLLPDLIILYLGKVAGFTTRSVGSLAQHTYDLEQYFQHGRYGDWPFEEESFSEMINKLEIE